jgi:hypothetical protein
VRKTIASMAPELLLRLNERKHMPKAKTSRAAKASIRVDTSDGIYPLKRWPTIKKRLVKGVRQSERLTKEDLAIRINTRG